MINIEFKAVFFTVRLLVEEQPVEITNLTALNQNKQGKMSGWQPAHFLQAVSDSALFEILQPSYNHSEPSWIN